MSIMLNDIGILVGIIISTIAMAISLLSFRLIKKDIHIKLIYEHYDRLRISVTDFIIACKTGDRKLAEANIIAFELQYFYSQEIEDCMKTCLLNISEEEKLDASLCQLRVVAYKHILNMGSIIGYMHGLKRL